MQQAVTTSLLGIAGGSGSGKSSASYFLVDSEPEIFEVLNLDDYQKLPGSPDLPMHAGMVNWDHPDVIRWHDVLSDIGKLRCGEEVVIDVWSHRSNPDYHTHRRMIPRVIKPKPILIVEGYLALYNLELLGCFKRKYFLELDEATRAQRRGKNEVIGLSEYETKVLIPMHKLFVEPSKHKADVILDVSNMNIVEAAQALRRDMLKHL